MSKSDLVNEKATRAFLTGLPVSAVYGDDQCWFWRGEQKDKYGQLYVDGKYYCGAHIYSFLYYKPEVILDGNVVRHSCDEKSCVNPQHLLQGTHGDNARDRELRGRNGSKRTALGRAKSALLYYRQLREEDQRWQREMKESE
jgi:hypothetical protein